MTNSSGNMRFIEQEVYTEPWLPSAESLQRLVFFVVFLFASFLCWGKKCVQLRFFFPRRIVYSSPGFSSKCVDVKKEGNIQTMRKQDIMLL